MEINLLPEEWFEILEIVDEKSTALMMADFDNLIKAGEKLAKVVSAMRAQISNQVEDKSLGFGLEKIRG